LEDWARRHDRDRRSPDIDPHPSGRPAAAPAPRPRPPLATTAPPSVVPSPGVDPRALPRVEVVAVSDLDPVVEPVLHDRRAHPLVGGQKFTSAPLPPQPRGPRAAVVGPAPRDGRGDMIAIRRIDALR